jgi:hypothetical protein
MKRPGRTPPQWAYDAAGGAIIEPAEGKAASGYAAGEVPPAMWWNYHHNLYGQWLGYLAGPSLTVWSTWNLPSPDTAYTPPHFAAVDMVSLNSAEARYRYAVAAIDATSACVLVSRTGQDWVLRRNLPGDPTDTPRGIVAGSVWTLWTDVAIYYSKLDDPAFPSSGVGACPLRDATQDWGTASLPASPGSIACVAGTLAGGAFVATTSTKLLYAGSGGSSYTAVSPSVSGRQAGRAIAWGQSAVVEISSDAGDGYVIRNAVDPADSASWTHVQTLASVGTETTWRLAVGPVADDLTATFVAFKTGTSNPRLHVSVDDGVTWTLVSVDVADGVPVSLGNLTSMRYEDGVWVATSTTWPYAWTSSDLERWLPLPVPVGETDSPLYDVVFGNGSWLLLSTIRATQGAPAIDASPEGYTPSTRAAVLGDAGWLRGRKISATAPTDGQVYAYDATSGTFIATTPSAGTTYTVATKTTTYTAAPGDVLLCDASGGAFTVTLPAAAGATSSISVKKSDASANAVTIDGDASETIDGATTRALSTQYEAVTLWSDGTSWWVF